MMTSRVDVSSLGGLLGAVLCLLVLLCSCSSAPGLRPQVGVQPTGERFPALPAKARVKIFFRNGPQESYREIGSITATCPQQHWVGGHHVKGRPVCVDGLRQGARKLGAHAVVDIETERYRPEFSPDEPWLIMEGVAVRLTR